MDPSYSLTPVRAEKDFSAKIPMFSSKPRGLAQIAGLVGHVDGQADPPQSPIPGGQSLKATVRHAATTMGEKSHQGHRRSGN